MKRSVIFDLDGTLIDSAPSILFCFSQVLKSNGFNVLCPISSSIIGPPLIPTLKKLTGLNDNKKLEELAEEFKNYYDSEHCLLSKPYDGVNEGLHKLYSDGFDLHIATNKRAVPTKNIIKHLGWDNFFSSIYTLDKENILFASKAEMIVDQIKKFKLNPKKSIYVGDRIEDQEAARLNSLKFVGVTWGYGNFASSQYAISSFSELAQFLS